MRLIDANALEKDMRAYADNKAYCGHIELANGILKAVGRINEAPTVDAVPVVHAEWRSDGFCTNCNNRAEVQSIGFNCTGGTRIEYKRTRFCPNCGAKMDRKDDT